MTGSSPIFIIGPLRSCSRQSTSAIGDPMNKTMNKTLLLSLCIVMALAPIGHVEANDKLLEILKGKGILTDEQFEELQKESSKELKPFYKDGFKLESRDKNFSMQISGRVQADFRYFDDSDKNDTFDIRRARLEAQGTLYKYFDYKVSVDFAGTATLKDAWINYKYFPGAQIKVGQFYYPFGNEDTASSKYFEFLEVSSITTALVPARDRGIAIHGDVCNGYVWYQAGIYNGAGENGTENNDDFDYAARFVYNPTAKSKGAFKAWVGASYGFGQQAGTSSTADISIKPETRSGNTYVSVDIPTNRSYDRQRMGAEATLLYGPAMLKGEFLRTTYDFEKKADIEGGYVTAGFFLTGEQRSVKNGQLARQTVKKPFDPEKGQWGAWELAARYSMFKVDDKFFRTNGLYPGWTAVSSTSYVNEGDAWTVALNWHLNPMIRVMANWVHSEASNDLSGGTSNIFTHDSGNATDVEDAFLMRVQLEF